VLYRTQLRFENVNFDGRGLQFRSDLRVDSKQQDATVKFTLAPRTPAYTDSFIAKLDRCARERVFVMLRESELPHPAALIRKRLQGDSGPPMPRFSDLFMLLLAMGIAPDVKFLSYNSVTRYANLDEALVDARALVGDGWVEAIGRPMLEELLTSDGGELVFDGGTVLSGVAHWQPRART